jgi:hypothetical protein
MGTEGAFMMKPEEIEYVREWAASGNKPRFAVDVEGVLPEELWKMLDKDEDTLCELAPVGIAVSSQAERIRELESDFFVLFPWLFAKYSHEEGSAGE